MIPENFITFLWVMSAIGSVFLVSVAGVMFVSRVLRAAEAKALAHRYKLAELEAEHKVRLVEIRVRCESVTRALVESEES